MRLPLPLLIFALAAAVTLPCHAQAPASIPAAPAINLQAKGSDATIFDGNGRLNTRPFHVDGAWEISWRGALSVKIMRVSGDYIDVFEGKDGSSFVPAAGDFYLAVNGLNNEDWHISIRPVEPPLTIAAPQKPSSSATLPLAAETQRAAAATAGADNGQTVFLATIEEARQKFDGAPTDIAKEEVHVWRKDAICKLLPSRTIANWIGKIALLSRDSGGRGIVEVLIGSDVHVRTWNNWLSDMGDNTLIEPESEVSKMLSGMKEGDEVQFSGTFLTSTIDCIQEGSLTQSASMSKPGFLMRFSSISLADSH